MPGKLYEYLSANKPILFIGPQDGDAANVIRTTRSGRITHYDEQSIYEALEHFYLAWKEGASVHNVDLETVSKFDRRLQSGKLAWIFNKLITGMASAGHIELLPSIDDFKRE